MLRTIRFLFLSVTALALPGLMQAQIGGTSTWTFLTLSPAARVASLGGKVAALPGDDLNLVAQNPGLLNERMHNQLTLNYVNYFTDVAYGNVAFSRSYGKIGNFAAGIQYINYGDFIAADPTGLITGEFKAAEYAVNLSYSRAIDSNFVVGITLKPVYSSFETYQSYGLAGDLGASYTSDDQLFAAGLSLRNFGTQFKGYYNNHTEPLPFEIIAGFSQKLAHAPFRFVVTAQQLQRFDLTYTNPAQNTSLDPITGKPLEKSKVEQFTDKTMRHLILGVEFTPLKSFCFRFAYNHKLRKEMSLDLKPAMVGFSWGLGLKLSRFQVNYGRAAYHLAGATNLFSFSTTLSSRSQRKNTETL
jgi:hypothetical protein